MSDGPNIQGGVSPAKTTDAPTNDAPIIGLKEMRWIAGEGVNELGAASVPAPEQEGQDWAETPEDFKQETAKALWDLVQREGVTRKSLALRMGRTPGFVSQFLSGRNLGLGTVVQAAEALGYKVKVSFSPVGTSHPKSVMLGESASSLGDPTASLLARNSDLEERIAALDRQLSEAQTALEKAHVQIKDWEKIYPAERAVWMQRWREWVDEKAQYEKDVDELDELVTLAKRERNDVEIELSEVRKEYEDCLDGVDFGATGDEEAEEDDRWARSWGNRHGE